MTIGGVPGVHGYEKGSIQGVGGDSPDDVWLFGMPMSKAPECDHAEMPRAARYATPRLGRGRRGVLGRGRE